MYYRAAVATLTQGEEGQGGAKPPQPGQDDPPDCAQLDTAAVVRAVVDRWPPLTDRQRERLSVLVRPGR